MIVTSTGIVCFPPDPLYAALTSSKEWVDLPTVTEHRLVRTFSNGQSKYLFIQANHSPKDYFAIKEKLTDDIRGKAASSSP